MCKSGTLPNNSSKNLRVRYLLLFLVACEMSTPMLSGMLERSVSPPTRPQTRLTTSSSPSYLNNSFSESVFEQVYPCNKKFPILQPCDCPICISNIEESSNLLPPTARYCREVINLGESNRIRPSDL